MLLGAKFISIIFPRLQFRSFCKTSTLMDSLESLQKPLSLLSNAYSAGVRAVLPHLLIPKYIKRDQSCAGIGDYSHKLNENVHLVGFGKAVISMVKPIEKILKDDGTGTSHLASGVISVPCEIRDTIQDRDLLPDDASVVKILEGAHNNLPDRAAHSAAQRILNLVENLKSNDLLLVLISGGGSALLPMPTPPLSLEEKSGIIRNLSIAGATINELNCVRKAISDAKGGKLAHRTKAKVIALVLSDVINNPLGVIASGPTVPNEDDPSEVTNILNKYKIPISSNLAEVLRKETKQSANDFSHVTNHIIGDNTVALEASKQYIERKLAADGLLGTVCIASTCLSGDATEVGECLAQLSLELMLKYNNKGSNDLVLLGLLDQLCITDRPSFIERVVDGLRQRNPLYILFGGETTVTVRGSGSGGRNQQMALAATVCFKQDLGADYGEELSGASTVLLSGGTDGIDGPTPAAGALTYWSPVGCQHDEAVAEGLVPEDFLANNDSFTFYKRLKGSKYLLQPGHTGTNVMDLQILCIQPPVASRETST